MLFGRDRIERLKREGTNDRIANPYDSLSIESDHNRIHNFVGGGLLDISNAPRDPMFFLLHCYIDYVWQEVRLAMHARGLDPQIYPFTRDSNHYKDLPMDGFGDWTNEEGYSNQWYGRHVRYEQSFDCASRCDGIEGLRCMDVSEGWERRRQCVSVRQTPVTTLPPITTLPPWWNWWNRRKKRAVDSQHAHDCGSAHSRKALEPKVLVCDRQTCPSGPSSMQNTFILNDVTDASLWVYIPIKVIYERPRGLQFHAYACYTGKHAPAINSTIDIYDPAFNPDLARHLYTGEARSYESCRISGEGAAKIFIRADGINYSGNSMEYAIMDERYPLSSQKAFIPIKDPTINDTEVCLLAYDSCGRLCLPTCRLKGSHPPAYAPCTGCVRVNNAYPRMYGRSIADIVAVQWSFNDVGYTQFLDPTESDEDVFLKFVCDSSSKFPWQRQGPSYN
ncbi:uncharacterized protein LOC110440914 [Mizuhopecten yessoensis]|uniref:uncharacterized protein LOC110440914 n=1 Tax=Mizuhopecten yessoensis TaxID=6573 RepID=UPI000B45ABFA|nr:uncharacterized protein LOC110440914 [Mizuhopecten yessoensis]